MSSSADRSETDHGVDDAVGDPLRARTGELDSASWSWTSPNAVRVPAFVGDPVRI